MTSCRRRYQRASAESAVERDRAESGSTTASATAARRPARLTWPVDRHRVRGSIRSSSGPARPRSRRCPRSATVRHRVRRSQAATPTGISRPDRASSQGVDHEASPSDVAPARRRRPCTGTRTRRAGGSGPRPAPCEAVRPPPPGRLAAAWSISSTCSGQGTRRRRAASRSLTSLSCAAWRCRLDDLAHRCGATSDTASSWPSSREQLPGDATDRGGGVRSSCQMFAISSSLGAGRPPARADPARDVARGTRDLAAPARRARRRSARRATAWPVPAPRDPGRDQLTLPMTARSRRGRQSGTSDADVDGPPARRRSPDAARPSAGRGTSRMPLGVDGRPSASGAGVERLANSGRRSSDVDQP